MARVLARRGAGRPTESDGRRRLRRPSGFASIGLLLATLTVVTVTWSYGVYTVDMFSTIAAPQFAGAGFVAAVFGWAAFAQSYGRAALRSMLAMVAFWALLIAFVAVLESEWGRSWIDRWRTEGQFTTILRSEPIISFDGAARLHALQMAALGALARAAAVAGTVIKRAGAAVAVVGAMLAMAWPDGREVVATVLFDLAAASWLVWALRRGRAEHIAGVSTATSAP